MFFDHFPCAQRRLLRLQAYFEPYDHFSVCVEDADVPFRFSSDVGSKTPRSYSVVVAERLLESVLPEDFEAKVLSAALQWECSVRNQQTSDYRALQEQFPVPERIYEDSLRAVWKSLQEKYFPERSDLLDYQLSWSQRRQTQSLASCSVATKRVHVARSMQHEDARAHLEALLYHEMVHAFLGEPPIENGKRIVHGPEFKQYESRHPQIPALNAWIKQGGWDRVVADVERA